MYLFYCKPCKQCGDDEGRTIYQDGAIPDDGYRMIICDGCGCEGPWGSSLTDAVRLWNDCHDDD